MGKKKCHENKDLLNNKNSIIISTSRVTKLVMTVIPEGSLLQCARSEAALGSSSLQPAFQCSRVSAALSADTEVSQHQRFNGKDKAKSLRKLSSS